MSYLFEPQLVPALSIRGLEQRFPVHRIYCVGRNFAEHAREMGSEIDRGTPVFFCKPADAIVASGGRIPYPPGTSDLHHEVELVVALDKDAPAGRLGVDDADALIFGYSVGLDLTRRDLQARAKSKGLPWDTAKAFDASAPVAELLDKEAFGALATKQLWLDVNGERRQQAPLSDMVWDVPAILVELSALYRLRAGDLIFMGTPAGVAALQTGDRFRAGLDDLITLEGEIVA